MVFFSNFFLFGFVARLKGMDVNYGDFVILFIHF